MDVIPDKTNKINLNGLHYPSNSANVIFKYRRVVALLSTEWAPNNGKWFLPRTDAPSYPQSSLVTTPLLQEREGLQSSEITVRSGGLYVLLFSRHSNEI